MSARTIQIDIQNSIDNGVDFTFPATYENAYVSAQTPRGLEVLLAALSRPHDLKGIIFHNMSWSSVLPILTVENRGAIENIGLFQILEDTDEHPNLPQTIAPLIYLKIFQSTLGAAFFNTVIPILPVNILEIEHCFIVPHPAPFRVQPHPMLRSLHVRWADETNMPPLLAWLVPESRIEEITVKGPNPDEIGFEYLRTYSKLRYLNIVFLPSQNEGVPNTWRSSEHITRIIEKSRPERLGVYGVTWSAPMLWKAVAECNPVEIIISMSNLENYVTPLLDHLKRLDKLSLLFINISHEDVPALEQLIRRNRYMSKIKIQSAVFDGNNSERVDRFSLEDYSKISRAVLETNMPNLLEYKINETSNEANRISEIIRRNQDMRHLDPYATIHPGAITIVVSGPCRDFIWEESNVLKTILPRADKYVKNNLRKEKKVSDSGEWWPKQPRNADHFLPIFKNRVDFSTYPGDVPYPRFPRSAFVHTQQVMYKMHHPLVFSANIHVVAVADNIDEFWEQYKQKQVPLIPTIIVTQFSLRIDRSKFTDIPLLLVCNYQTFDGCLDEARKYENTIPMVYTIDSVFEAALMRGTSRLFPMKNKDRTILSWNMVEAIRFECDADAQLSQSATIAPLASGGVISNLPKILYDLHHLFSRTVFLTRYGRGALIALGKHTSVLNEMIRDGKCAPDVAVHMVRQTLAHGSESVISDEEVLMLLVEFEVLFFTPSRKWLVCPINDRTPTSCRVRSWLLDQPYVSNIRNENGQLRFTCSYNRPNVEMLVSVSNRAALVRNISSNDSDKKMYYKDSISEFITGELNQHLGFKYKK